jgi:DNA repair exonuclease SbcCD nuclease subunit
VHVLHLTDTHLGIHRYVRGGPPRWTRADDHENSFRRALAPALREEVDLVVHTGDLFNRSRPPTRAVARAAAVLREVARRVPVVILPGNHDRRGLRRHLPHPDPGLRVVDRPTRVVVAGLALAAVPFLRTAEGWAEGARRAVGPGADLLLAHQAFHGARVPGLTFRVGAQRDTVGAAHLPRGVTHVLCGHIHPRQVLRVGAAEVVHPGSTERAAFSERAETKGYALWTVDSRVSWRFVDLPSRPMLWLSRHADLERVAPGTLVRLRTTSVPEAAVLERGGLLVGPPPGAARTSFTRHPLPAQDQIPLFR